jgi:divalent metal cation (Fe/Co/Zn/Cd) transporter
MRPVAEVEFPPEVEVAYRRARRLEWITIAYLTSTVVLLYFVMGSSQAMRTSFFEDLISVVPAVAFLIGTAIARRAPRPDYPYGMHRATSIAYLVAALALCVMGAFLLVEAAMAFLAEEKSTIGGFTLFGEAPFGVVVWAGWPMLAVLAYTGVPSFFLGRAKVKLAPQLHDKVLFADAKMMKADWMAESAAAVGVLGAGFGVWWLDPLAAALVSADILKDGLVNLKVAVLDLANRRPVRIGQSGPEPVPAQLREQLLGLPWVAEAEVRLREEGHIFMGEAFVVPRPGTTELPRRIEAAAEAAKSLDWRVHELAIMPVQRLPGARGVE